MPVTSDKPAPYAPPSAIMDLIERYRDRGLPLPINAEVLGRASVSGSLIPRTLQALQALDLIDEAGQPTPTFESIRAAPEGEYKKRLQEWLHGAFADVFLFVDPARDDEVAIRDAFRDYQPLGQQPRMVTLFRGLCDAAGLSGDKTQQTRAPARPRAPSTPLLKRAAVKPTPTKIAAGTGQTGIPAPIAGLLAGLPAQGAGWTKSEREKFLNTFGAVLDFCFPVVERSAEADQDEQE